MRKKLALIMMSAMLLTACGEDGKSSAVKTSAPVTPGVTAEVTVDDAANNKVEITDDFKIVSTALDGVNNDGSTYTIKKGGEITITGALKSGQVIVDAGEEEVEISLEGASITCSDGAPIYIKSAKSVKLKAKDGSYNELIDARAIRTTEVDETDEKTASAAVFATCDLEIAGKGSLVVKGGYNNGIGTKDKLSIKNLTLKVEAVNNSLKGNDKVTIESGEIMLVSTEGSCIKTSNNGTTKKGKVKGDIEIKGGSISVDAFKTGIDAISNVVIEDGAITAKSENKAVHGDLSVTVSGGTLKVSKASEGIESNVVNISGGNVDIYASDDGINACQGATTPLVNVSGGYLMVETPSGDTDAIDSNGDYLQTGGIAIIKGGAATGNMAGSVDVDGKVTVTGGTILALGGICEVPEEGSVNAYAEGGLKVSAGELVVKASDGSEVFKAAITSSFSGMWIASDKLKTGTSYTMTLDGSELVSWEQTEGTIGNFNIKGGMGGHGDFNKPEGERPDKQGGERPDGFDGQRPERPEGERPGKFN